MTVLPFRRKTHLRLVPPLSGEKSSEATPPAANSTESPTTPTAKTYHPRFIFLDEFLDPIDVYPNKPDALWHVCRSNEDAIDYVEKYGLPEFMSLGYVVRRETVKPFIVWLMDIYKAQKIPTVACHAGDKAGGSWILATFAMYEEHIRRNPTP